MTGTIRRPILLQRCSINPGDMWRFVCLMLVILLFVPRFARGQEVRIDREAKIKAAYILKLVSYVEWPAAAYADDMSPLVLGVIGESDVAPYVELITRQRTVGNRSLAFKRVTDAQDVRACHLLFISEQVDQDMREKLTGTLATAPVLFVAEESKYITRGKVITFVVQDNRVRLQLSMLSASQRNLKISSQLAKLAEVID